MTAPVTTEIAVITPKLGAFSARVDLGLAGAINVLSAEDGTTISVDTPAVCPLTLEELVELHAAIGRALDFQMFGVRR